MLLATVLLQLKVEGSYVGFIVKPWKVENRNGGVFKYLFGTLNVQQVLCTCSE